MDGSVEKNENQEFSNSTSTSRSSSSTDEKAKDKILIDEILIESIKFLVDKYKNIIDQLDGLEKRLGEAEDKIENTSTKIIETIGILIGLFTFISIEFQIFNSEFSLQEAGGLTMIILGGMLMFITTIDFFIKLDLPLFESPEKTESGIRLSKGFWIRLIFIILSLALLTIGVLLFSYSEKTDLSFFRQVYHNYEENI